MAEPEDCRAGCARLCPAARTTLNPPVGWSGRTPARPCQPDRAEPELAAPGEGGGSRGRARATPTLPLALAAAAHRAASGLAPTPETQTLQYKREREVAAREADMARRLAQAEAEVQCQQKAVRQALADLRAYKVRASRGAGLWVEGICAPAGCWGGPAGPGRQLR